MCALLRSFLLAVTQFAVPTFAFVKDRPIPYVTHDIALSGEICAPPTSSFLAALPPLHLCMRQAGKLSLALARVPRADDMPCADAALPTAAPGEPHRADADLFLCPAVRLLADAPGVHSFEYDGGGHCLVLPDKDNLGEGGFGAGRGWAALCGAVEERWRGQAAPRRARLQASSVVAAFG